MHRTTSHRRKSTIKFPPRICQCGCGRKYRPTRFWQKFVNAKHRTLAFERNRQETLAAAKKVLEAHAREVNTEVR